MSGVQLKGSRLTTVRVMTSQSTFSTVEEHDGTRARCPPFERGDHSFFKARYGACVNVTSRFTLL